MRLWDILKTDITPPFLRKYEAKRMKTKEARRRPWWRRLWKGPILARRQAKRRNLIAVFGQLDAIVRANAPLAGGLRAASLDGPNSTVRAVLATVGDGIEGGASLSEAAETLPRFFPPHIIDLLRAGEDTGKLEESLARILEQLTREFSEGAGRQVNLIYIFYLFFIHLFIGPFLVIKVIPVYQEIFSEFGSKIPGPTQLLVDTSEFLTVNAFYLLLLVAWVVFLALIGPSVHRRSPRLQTLVTFCLLPIPFVGTMHVKKNVARLARILEKLVTGGIPLPDALKSAATAKVNAPFTKALLRVAGRVEQGNMLSEAMEGEKLLFRQSLRTLVSLGETSGMLPEACAQAADLYERDAARTERMMADAVVPVCVIASACATFLVYVGLMTATIGMADIFTRSM